MKPASLFELNTLKIRQSARGLIAQNVESLATRTWSCESDVAQEHEGQKSGMATEHFFIGLLYSLGGYPRFKRFKDWIAPGWSGLMARERSSSAIAAGRRPKHVWKSASEF